MYICIYVYMYICINPIRLFALGTFSTESNFQTPFRDLSAQVWHLKTYPVDPVDFIDSFGHRNR